MRKGRDEEKKWEMEHNDILVATIVIASQPPERQPTGTPTACANFLMISIL